jgi:hypothetical protein
MSVCINSKTRQYTLTLALVEHLRRKISELKEQARAADEASARVLAHPSTEMRPDEVGGDMHF